MRKRRKCNKKTKLSIDGIQAHCPLPLLQILKFDAMCFFFLWKPSYYVCGEEECNKYDLIVSYFFLLAHHDD